MQLSSNLGENFYRIRNDLWDPSNFRLIFNSSCLRFDFIPRFSCPWFERLRRNRRNSSLALTPPASWQERREQTEGEESWRKQCHEQANVRLLLSSAAATRVDTGGAAR